MLKTNEKQIIINYYLKKGGKKMSDEIKLELFFIKLEQFHQNHIDTNKRNLKQLRAKIINSFVIYS